MAKIKNCRCGKVGGQAVMEGIMMRSPKLHSTAVRLADGKITVKTEKNKTIKDKIKFFKIPVIRGVVNFIETLKLSMSILTYSADALGIEEEPTKFEKWLEKHFGKSLTNIAVAIGGVLGIFLAFVLFFFLPTAISKLVGEIANLGFFKNILEGVIRIAIFVAYVALVGLVPDIKRTYEYHGAEHKSIFCYEAGEELTVENIKKQSRFHPRCGTSFMFVMMILGILVSSLPFITWDNLILRVVTKLCMLPLIVGVGYEIIMFAGKHDNIIVKIITAPGLWMQRLTTKEPDDREIEVAIVALKSSIPEEFPEQEVFAGIEQPDDDTATDE